MKSALVSIPLSITQSFTQTVHNHCFTLISPEEVFLNIALSYSIYGNDRLEDSSGFLETSLVKLGTASSMAYLVSDTYTLPLSLLVPFLTYEYAETKKKVSRILN